LQCNFGKIALKFALISGKTYSNPVLMRLHEDDAARFPRREPVRLPPTTEEYIFVEIEFNH
jgi:hypothetical protein